MSDNTWIVENLMKHKPNVDWFTGVITMYPKPKGIIQEVFEPGNRDSFARAFEKVLVKLTMEETVDEYPQDH